MQYYSNNINELTKATHLRFLHASPNAPTIDVYANGNLVIKGSSYRNFSDYFKANTGKYEIKIYESGKTDNPIIGTIIRLEEGLVYTMAIAGDFPKINIVPVIDSKIKPEEGKGMMRLIHLSPDTVDVDVFFNGVIAATDLEYSEVTEYFAFDTNNYTIKVEEVGTDNTILTIPNTKLTAGKFLAAYLIGFNKKSPGLQMLLPLEGISYL